MNTLETVGLADVFCPFCGKQLPGRRSRYEDDQEAAEDAAAQCDCAEAREWRQIKIPRRNKAGDKEAMVLGVCRFCGQTMALSKVTLSETGLSARECASRLCGCPGAAGYQITLENEQARAEKLQEAYQNIEIMFLNRDDGQNMEAVTGIMMELVGMVYDEHLKKVSLQISAGVAAVIGRTASGSIRIEKKQKRVESAEV